jgi:hypothetical protein
MIKCPNCGQRLEIAPPALTIRQRIIRDTIEAIQRDNGCPARTIEVAARTGYRLATLKNELKYMESRHILHRPAGQKSGWALNGDDEILLIPARSRAA